MSKYRNPISLVNRLTSFSKNRNLVKMALIGWQTTTSSPKKKFTLSWYLETRIADFSSLQTQVHRLILILRVLLTFTCYYHPFCLFRPGSMFQPRRSINFMLFNPHSQLMSTRFTLSDSLSVTVRLIEWLSNELCTTSLVLLLVLDVYRCVDVVTIYFSVFTLLSLWYTLIL